MIVRSINIFSICILLKTMDELTDISANLMYFIIIGCKETILNIISILNKKKDNIKYISYELYTPCSYISRKTMKKTFPNIKDSDYIIFADGIEMAQTFVYSNEYEYRKLDEKIYMILAIKHYNDKYNIYFPKIHLHDRSDPKNILKKWIKKHNIIDMMKMISVRYITTIKLEQDISVISVKILP